MKPYDLQKAAESGGTGFKPVQVFGLNKIFWLGRLFFAISIAALGAEHLIWAGWGDPNSALVRDFAFTPIIPFMPLLPGNPILVYLTGLVLLPAGLSILANRQARLASIFLAVFFLLCVLLLEVPRAIAAPLDISLRTAFFETLALSASALILAGLSPSQPGNFLADNAAVNRLIQLGPILFAVSSIVFGVDHFLILNGIARLVPAWIPGALFWAYLTGAGFVAAGVCIAIRWLDYWAGFWLGTMFLLWFLLLHAPRVVSYPRSHSPAEWSSAFIALGMYGGSWICAWHSARQS
jgi:uncharacterized membrane protein